jgi:hypothetical protein
LLSSRRSSSFCKSRRAVRVQPPHVRGMVCNGNPRGTGKEVVYTN